MLTSCRAGNAGQVLCIRGDPGMGKSRLVGEMLRLAQARGFDTQRTLILDFGTGKGQDAIRALVRGLLGLAVDAFQDDRRAAPDRALENLRAAVSRDASARSASKRSMRNCKDGCCTPLAGAMKAGNG